MKRRGKVIALSTAATGVAVLIFAGIGAKDWMREEWYLWQLEEGDEQEQMVAAKKLGELKSARAASRLVAAFRMNAKKAAEHPLEEMSLRMDFTSARVYKGYIEDPDYLSGIRAVHSEHHLSSPHMTSWPPSTLVEAGVDFRW